MEVQEYKSDGEVRRNLFGILCKPQNSTEHDCDGYLPVCDVVSLETLHSDGSPILMARTVHLPKAALADQLPVVQLSPRDHAEVTLTLFHVHRHLTAELGSEVV